MGSIEEADYSQTYLAQMYPPEEASSDEEQYCGRSAWHLDIRSAWHLQSDVRSAWYLQSDIPPQMYPPWRHLVMKSSTMSDQLDIYRCKVSLTFTVRHMVSLTFTVRHTQVRFTLRRGIWWPRAVLCQVIFTFGDPLGKADIQSDVSPVEASGGQAWY